MSHRRVEVQFEGGTYEVYFQMEPRPRAVRVERHGINRKANARDGGATQFSRRLGLDGRIALAVINVAKGKLG